MTAHDLRLIAFTGQCKLHPMFPKICIVRDCFGTATEFFSYFSTRYEICTTHACEYTQAMRKAQQEAPNDEKEGPLLERPPRNNTT